VSTTFTLDQASVNRVLGNLQRVNKGVARKHLLIGLNAAGGPAKTVAQARAARETGLLQKSMIVKVPRDKNTRIPTGVLIGASRKVQRHVHTRVTRTRVFAKRVSSAEELAAERYLTAAQLKAKLKGTVVKGTKSRGVSEARAAKLILQGKNVRLRKPSRYAHLAERKAPAINAAFRTLQTVGVAKLHQKIEQGIAAEPMRS
jgi:RNase H-fold protein (predicted Holliday junction resolvase)